MPAVVRQVQTRTRVLKLYIEPPAIIHECVKKAAEQEHKPIPPPQTYLVLQCLHSLRAYMPEDTPMTIEEQEKIINEIRVGGRITLTPQSLIGTHPSFAPMSSWAAKIPDSDVDDWHGAGPPIPAHVPINTQIQQYYYSNNLGSADAEYCFRAKAFVKSRIPMLIGNKRDDDYWPYKRGPNAIIPLRR